MKRSTGVTGASICVIAASVAYAAYTLVTVHPMVKEGFALLLAGSIFQLLFCAWGIATGIALLRLRRWAWACVLVISGVMILFCVPDLLRAPKLIRATTGVATVSAGRFVSSQYLHLIFLGIVPVILAIWWLAFFLRRSVRAQFAPAAILLAPEANPPLVRSGAVDASAIVLLFGSAFVLLLAVMTPLSVYAPPRSPAMDPFRRMLIVVGIVYLLVAAWGVVTGIGALKRHAWSRILMIVTGVLGVAFAVIGSLGLFMTSFFTPPNPQLPASIVRDTIITGSLAMLIPLGISIWWLVLFTRPRIALEFASGGAASAAAPPISSPLAAAQPQPTASAIPAPLQFAATASAPPLFARPQIPMSIRVIAVLEILFGALALLGPLQVKSMGMKPSLLIFGFLVHGWGVDAFYLASGILPIAFCIAVLLRKRWGLDALIAFLLATIANIALTFVSPAHARWNAEVRVQMQSAMSKIKMPDGSTAPPPPIFSHMNLFYGVTFGTTVVLYAVLLYFLFTRRRAFRAACLP